MSDKKETYHKMAEFIKKHKSEIIKGISLYPIINRVNYIDKEIIRYQELLVNELRSKYVRREDIRFYKNQIDLLNNERQKTLKIIEKCK